ncbi:MAG: hypothetical protein S0880_14115 [Actinomycetota bacterium]|nr:hypothetical protein [Actinomycetota bacterium]
MGLAGLGPVQVVAVRFGADATFEGLVLDELERLSARGVIRVLDLQFLRTGGGGRLEPVTLAELDEGGADTDGAPAFGSAVAALLRSAADATAAPDVIDLDAGTIAGMGPADVIDAATGLDTGDLLGVVLVEHVWAAELRDAIRLAGGTPIAQGFLTPEAVTLMGAELEAMAEAEAAIEIADAIRGAAVLDALATIEAAEQIRAAAAAEAVGALIAAGLVADAAATDAVEALVAAGLVEAAALEEASAATDAAFEETATALAAMQVAGE